MQCVIRRKAAMGTSPSLWSEAPAGAHNHFPHHMTHFLINMQRYWGLKNRLALRPKILPRSRGFGLELERSALSHHWKHGQWAYFVSTWSCSGRCETVLLTLLNYSQPVHTRSSHFHSPPVLASDFLAFDRMRYSLPLLIRDVAYHSTHLHVSVNFSSATPKFSPLNLL